MAVFKTTWFSAAIIGFCILSLFKSSLGAASGDEHWDPQFGWPGRALATYAITFHNGQLYSGGIGESSTNTTLNMWDGERWLVKARFTNGFAHIWQLASVEGYLYVGGTMSQVNGMPITNFARWDGYSWEGLGFSGFPRAFAVNGTELYVGGSFTNLGGVAATNIARWDGNSWHALGDGLGPGVSGTGVKTLLWTNGVLYAGGNFTESGSNEVRKLVQWDGTNWLQVGDGISTLAADTLAFKGTDLYVGDGPIIRRWDGTEWWDVGGFDANVNHMSFFSDLLYATGDFESVNGIEAARFAIWDGISWSAAGKGLDRTGEYVFPTPTNIYVCGIFTAAGGGFVNSIAAWDGTNWNPMGSLNRTNGISDRLFAIASKDSNLYVGGEFDYASNLTVSNIARFDGNAWYPLGIGADARVTALASDENTLYAGGHFGSIGGISAQRVARWDGVNWHPMGDGIPGSVSTLAVRSNELFAGGSFSFTTPNGTASGVAQWDGTNWLRVVGDLAPGNFFDVASIVFHNNELIVGGIFTYTNSSGILCSNLARWNGTDWQSFGTGVNGHVYDLTLFGTNIVVGGQFTSAGGLPATNIAMWNGSSWSDVGGGVTGPSFMYVMTLTTVGNSLFAGGVFENAGAIPARNIARWNGTNWSSLGSGLSATSLSLVGIPTCLVATDSNLYVGGTFEKAGNKPSYYIARWNESIDFNASTRIHLTDTRRSPDGVLKFTVTVDGMAQHVVETTTNFSSWVPLATNSQEYYQFSDNQSPSHPSRLYRTRLLP